MHHFRVKLCCIKLFFRYLHRRHRTHRGCRRYGKFRRRLRNVIGVAHPANRFLADPFEKNRRAVHGNFRFPIFADWRCLHLSTEQVGHQLGAITNSENGNSQLKNILWTSRRTLTIDTIGTTSKYYPFGVHFPDPVQAYRIGMYLAVYIALSYPPGN